MAGVLAVALPAYADPSESEVVAAREMFQQARALERESKWPEALDKLVAVGQVRMTPQVRFHIALCLKNTGKLVAARNAFEDARREGTKQGADQVVLEAGEHIADLVARTPQLRLEVPGDVANLEVSIDGQRVAVSILAVPLPLDPGTHQLSVTAPGRQTFEEAIKLEERKVSEIAVTLPVAEGPPPVAVVTPIAKPAPPPAAPKPIEEGNTNTTVGWVALGGGAALLVGAGISALVRGSAISEIDDQCPSHQNCDPSLQDTRDRAQTFGVLSGVLGIVGVAAAGTGGVLLWTASDGRPDAAAIRVNPSVAGSEARITGVVQW